VALQLKPGLRAVLERLPHGWMRLHWILVGTDDVSVVGAFEGTEAEVRAALEQQTCPLERYAAAKH
jgi:hypothetical protein